MTLKRTQDGSVFLKHRLPLGTDRIAKLVLPVDLSAREAIHIQQFIDALILPIQPKKSVEVDWPFDRDGDDFLVDGLDDDDEEEELEEEEDCILTEADLESPRQAHEPSALVGSPLSSKQE